MFELTKNHFRKWFSVKPTRLSATDNRFFVKSFLFDQNLHLLTRKSFYMLILPSNDFRSTLKRLSQNTRGERTQRERERERYVHRADRRWSRLRRSRFAIEVAIEIAISFANRDRDRVDRDHDLPIVISPSFVRIWWFFFWVLFVFWGMNYIMFSFSNRENVSNKYKMCFLRYFQEHNQTSENIFRIIFWNATKHMKDRKSVV